MELTETTAFWCRYFGLTSKAEAVKLAQMDTAISYFSFVALVLVVILLVWSLVLAYQARGRRVSMRARLAELRRKVEAFPEKTPEDKAKKDSLVKELQLEYLDSILAEVEKIPKEHSPKQPKRRGKKNRRQR